MMTVADWEKGIFGRFLGGSEAGRGGSGGRREGGRENGGSNVNCVLWVYVGRGVTHAEAMGVMNVTSQ